MACAVAVCWFCLFHKVYVAKSAGRFLTEFVAFRLMLHVLSGHWPVAMVALVQDKCAKVVRKVVQEIKWCRREHCPAVLLCQHITHTIRLQTPSESEETGPLMVNMLHLCEHSQAQPSAQKSMLHSSASQHQGLAKCEVCSVQILQRSKQSSCIYI